MKLLFSNNQTVNLTIDNSPLGLVYQKIYKNLSQIPIPFRPWDNPYYTDNLTYPEMVERLIDYGQQVDLTIDRTKCLEKNQDYFNAIHKIYEKGYNGNPDWLNFHEHIHLCEFYLSTPSRILHIDYREKSGPLEKAIMPEWLNNTKTKIQAGEIFVSWTELGKNPYTYWENNEPDDMARMCELAKPWLKLRPKICIAVEDMDRLADIKRDEFEDWWESHSQAWTTHWNLSSWTIDNIHGASIFGKTDQLDLLIEQLKNNVVPVKVLLE
jgi:hypothetical protein